MITLKRLNVVRIVDTKQKAEKLEEMGFVRVLPKETKNSTPAGSEKAEGNQDGGNDKPNRRGGKKQPEADGGTDA